MPANKIAENIYSVGVAHPDLRVFDLLMPLPYGTTYNSFLLTGEKNVLIDTVKLQFADEFINNIKQVVDPSKIDYIVIQHNELDHSGSLPLVLKLAPNARVIISKTAENFLLNSFNAKFEYMKVDDSTEISFGAGKTLKFFTAPFLHWPDTMFTHFVEAQALFTCDAFGAHYCQKKGFFGDEMPTDEYGDHYFHQHKVYFDIIMRLYSPKVVEAVRKVSGLELKLLCPSHGPLFRRDIGKIITRYGEWATPKASPDGRKKVTIVYSSMYGSTMKVAHHLESLLKKRGVTACVAEVPFAMTDEQLTSIIGQINESDGVLFGTSTVCSTILKPMWDFLFFMATVDLKGKAAGIFGSYGWDAQGLKLVELLLNNYKMNVMKNIFKVKFVPSPEKLEPCDEFIDEFVKALEAKAPAKSVSA